MTIQRGNPLLFGTPQPLFNEVYDFSEANALLGGLGIVFVSEPLSPKSVYRFSALLSFMWSRRTFRSSGFEMGFPEKVDHHHISYEFEPGGHVFTYEGPVGIRQVVLEDMGAFGNYNSTYSYEFVAKDKEIQEIRQYIASGTLKKLNISEGVKIRFSAASEAE